jgi:sulfide:quinone oxidoreductase
MSRLPFVKGLRRKEGLMVQLISIDEKTSVAGQLSSADLQQVAAAGVKLIVSNRPDGEVFDQPPASELAAEAAKLGVSFIEIPFKAPGAMTPEQVAQFAKLLSTTEGKVLAFCRSGTRSATLWAAANCALGRDVDDVLSKTAKAGYDLRQAAAFIQDIGRFASRLK